MSNQLDNEIAHEVATEHLKPTEQNEDNSGMLENPPQKKLGKKGIRVSRVMDEHKSEILRLAREKALEVRKQRAQERKIELENQASINNVTVQQLKKQLKKSNNRQITPEEVEQIKLEERINSIVNQKLMKLQVKENKEIHSPKKPTKKKIVYEDSDSEEEEVIIKRRPKKKIEEPVPPPPIPQQSPQVQPSAHELQQRQFMEFQNQIHNAMLNQRMRIPRMGR